MKNRGKHIYDAHATSYYRGLNHGADIYLQRGLAITAFVTSSKESHAGATTVQFIFITRAESFIISLLVSIGQCARAVYGFADRISNA